MLYTDAAHHDPAIRRARSLLLVHHLCGMMCLMLRMECLLPCLDASLRDFRGSALLQERNRLPDVADDELNVPSPEPLRFNIDEPALLDDDMVEILLLEEAGPWIPPLPAETWASLQCEPAVLSQTARVLRQCSSVENAVRCRTWLPARPCAMCSDPPDMIYPPTPRKSVS